MHEWPRRGWPFTGPTRCSLWALGLMLLANLSVAAAADLEYRDFQILVDKKPAGQYQLVISRHDDGTYAISGQADVRVSYLAGLYTYTYSYRGSELWKDGRLLQLDSTANDDGKKFAVSARADGNALRVTVNGREHTAPADVWTTTCWRLPELNYRQADLVLLDADTGREIKGRLQFVGRVKFNVAGQMQDCVHYRVSGGLQLDLWFDLQGRLVRQEGMEDGHRTILELTRIRR